MRAPGKPWNIWVDTGGTFTDCIGTDPAGNLHSAKVLSNSSLRGELVARLGERLYRIDCQWNAPDDFIKGLNFLLLGNSTSTVVLSYHAKENILELQDEIAVENFPASFEVRFDEEAPILAARLLTKTLPGRPLPVINLRLATTLGTNAFLERKGTPPLLFITKGFEDLLKIGNQQRGDLFALEVIKPPVLYGQVFGVPERIGADGNVIYELDNETAVQIAKNARKSGVDTAAIVLMNSPKNRTHEITLKSLLTENDFHHISVSTELSDAITILPRAETTVVNAYLSPVLNSYLNSIRKAVPSGTIHVMTSAGGLSSIDSFQPKESLLSGPAGGVVGAVSASKKEGFNEIISFDMGGTSTDVARYSGHYDYVFKHKVGDAQLVSPAVNVETVAAGGGSVCYFDGHKLCVGPESAGSYPGPACYGAGGPFTITDVNVLLNRLDLDNFQIPIEVAAAEKKLEKIIQQIEKALGKKQHREQILNGFLTIANEKMAEAIRKISVKKGYDIKNYALTAFGGAGGQHACAIASGLGVKNVLIPPYSGLLSAYGLGMAQPEKFSSKQILQSLKECKDQIDGWISERSKVAKERLYESFPGYDGDLLISRKIISLRFFGQENSIDIDVSDGVDIYESFRKSYINQFGHWLQGGSVEVESIRVAAVLDAAMPDLMNTKSENRIRNSSKRKDVWFDGGLRETRVLHAADVEAGQIFDGPAIVMDPYSTIVVEPGWVFEKKPSGAIILSSVAEQRSATEKVDGEAIELELFTNRFTAIAEQMGEILRRTALSVNVKDRLDFSCALLSPEGDLIVNAPHIPVHLGAMGTCVKAVLQTMELNAGDVVVTNHPAFGGSHLPDVTVITPIFADKLLLGFAANRAHHAEIGGKSPGSMPPDAVNLAEEGVVIPPMHLIFEGAGQWDKIENLLTSGIYPTRNVKENLADLRAAVAANQYGVNAMVQLADQHGAGVLLKQMKNIRFHSSKKMREMITSLPKGEFRTQELLDNGTPLSAVITIKEESITFDFTGTGPVQSGNLNATPAIVHSVIMYLLRLLIDEDVPLNDGLFDPVKIILPKCLLNPVFEENPVACPALVGGNTEISQRLTDTLLKPFDKIACSQGTMNNVLFGNEQFGYYETIGGGTGAGDGFNGAHAIHHHMTNTRGTDPEIFEHKYPVRLNRYAIRKASGGEGKFRGGDGIIRDCTFLEPVYLSVLTQHRIEKPYGLHGGEDGASGNQFIIRKNGVKEELAPVDGIALEAGDRFVIHTPGGGGYGKPDEE
ncbi:MAG: 5-oxoprolinase [Balneolaceae bacterium]|nr:MAG: 5-oxoprolinase [Balneolaceae bacterium]